MSDRLRAAFPGLAASRFRVTSPADAAYNCIAWAAGRVDEWWWPIPHAGRSFWPDVAPRACTLDAFRAAFLTLGYVPCPDETFESGFEKIAVFTDADGRPTHAARQLSTGRWTSKLGQAEDIEHDLWALEGDVYGAVALILKRPALSASADVPS